MKIAYCITGTYNSGGMERILSNKVNYLADIMDYDISIITTDQQNKQPFFFFSDKIKFYDLDINYTNDIEQNIFVRKLLSYKKRKLHKHRLTQLLDQQNFDIVVSMMDDDFYFLYQIKDSSIKIAEFHFSRFSRLPQSGIKKIFKEFYKKSDTKIARRYSRFIVLTNEDKEWWKELDNVDVIFNSISNIPQSQALLHNKIVISVGRLTFQKGFDRLIKSWKMVALENPDWKLYIYGNGELECDLKKLIRELSLEDNIKIFPAVKNIENVYLNASIYVMSSRYEGLGMVLVEASSYGIPIISFNCPCGPNEIIENGYNGILVPNGNIEKLSSEINHLIQNHELRQLMGNNGRKYIIDKFDNNKIMNQWISLFNELLILKK